jgi:hypothetical protein
MAKYAQGIFTPKFSQKYVGKHAPRYRSGWEQVFMRFCDENDSVLYWASEAMAIPYKNPFTGKNTVYIPDFFVVYQNKFGQQLAEVIEIKPKKQSIVESKASNRDKMVVALNHIKWAAATAYCKQQGYKFRVINEDQIFHTGKK